MDTMPALEVSRGEWSRLALPPWPRAGTVAVLLTFLAAACTYGPVVPDRVVACQVAADCPVAGDQCVPFDDGPVSVCCHDCAPPDAAAPPDAPVTRDAPLAPDASSDAGPPAPPPCPESRGGPPLVRVGEFCIDATEVTNAQYAVFWTATGAGRNTAGQPPVCVWNTTFTPDTGGAPWPFRPGTERRPVVNVDWCDASAFCRWAGKRLCGSRAGTALTSWDQSGDPARSQWMYACSSGGKRLFPYGDEYQANVCNTAQPRESVAALADVGSRPGCRTEAGVYDLSGNVEEWTDACDGNQGERDRCASVGQSAYLDPANPPDFSCAGSFYPDLRSASYELRGFRCCAP
jgi:sulfatase modifying factor 1